MGIKVKYKKQLTKEFKNKVEKIDQWEKDCKDGEVWNFYERILYYYFYGSVHVDLYTFIISKGTCCGDDDNLNFVLGLQNFLGNCVLDDSYYTVVYLKLRNGKFVETDDPTGEPCIVWGGAEEKGSQSIAQLEELLDYVIERNKIKIEANRKFMEELRG